MTRRWYPLRVILYGMLALCCLTASSQQKGGNGGILYGEGFAFGFQAPHGWVLDNQSGVEQGLDAVFYPVGQTWAGSPVMAYANARPRTKSINSAADVVHNTLNDLHSKGNPRSAAVRMPPLTTRLGRSVKIYYYTGDKYGNYEAAAYIVEAKTISFFILSSKQKALFYKSLPAFQSLVKTYFFMENMSKPPTKPAPSDSPAKKRDDTSTT